MGRIRTVKPGFFVHGELYDAEKQTGLPLRLAYAGLWTVADREGRFAWKPREIKLQILPYDEVDMAHVLDALMTRGWVVKYEIEGRPYGWLPTFRKHQSVNNRESTSRLPAPPENLLKKHEIASIPDAPESGGPRVDDASGTPLQGKGREGKGDLSPHEPPAGGPGVMGARTGAALAKPASSGKFEPEGPQVGDAKAVGGALAGPEIDAAAVRVVLYLNAKAGRNFDPKDRANLRPVKRHLARGVPERECLALIDSKLRARKKGDAVQELTPSRIFKPKDFAEHHGTTRLVKIDEQILTEADRGRMVFNREGRLGEVKSVRSVAGTVLVDWGERGVKEENPEGLSFQEPKQLKLV